MKHHPKYICIAATADAQSESAVNLERQLNIAFKSGYRVCSTVSGLESDGSRIGIVIMVDPLVSAEETR